MYREMGTDTGDDLRTARDPNHLLKKEQEIMQMK